MALILASKSHQRICCPPLTPVNRESLDCFVTFGLNRVMSGFSLESKHVFCRPFIIIVPFMAAAGELLEMDAAEDGWTVPDLLRSLFLKVWSRGNVHFCFLRNHMTAHI